RSSVDSAFAFLIQGFGSSFRCSLGSIEPSDEPEEFFSSAAFECELEEDELSVDLSVDVLVCDLLLFELEEPLSVEFVDLLLLEFEDDEFLLGEDERES